MSDSENESHVEGFDSSGSYSGQCMSCHWWFRFDESKLVGDCVWHNGTKKTNVSKLRFSGILKTQADFGCVDWSEDRRNNSE